MKDNVFSYVILHYKTDKDTIECVNSIFDSDDSSVVVIVDNASDNGSIEIIEKKYKKNPRVHILKNAQNLGFAEGNNVGYKYARDVLKADYIAISNNDIIICSNNLSELVKSIYEDTHFYVLGPDIVSIVDGGHQNPMEESLTTAKEIKKEITRYKLLLLLSKCGLYDYLKRNNKVRTGSSRDKIPSENTKDVMLHGSFVVFSPDFIRNEEISFRKGTFLYTEEAILRKYCMQKDYQMVFAPSICVMHKEDSATNSLKLTNKEKREFVFSNMIRSLSVYLSYFE